MLNEFRLAYTQLLRELRKGQWAIILIALVLAVTTITAVNFYTDRLSRGLDRESAKMLGGDLAISSPRAIKKEWVDKAKEFSLQTAELLIFPSVVSANNQLQLANIQAVSDNYPLLGDKIDIKSKSILAEPRLLTLLSSKVGDSMMIGATSFTIEGIQTTSMDSLNTGWAIAPRVIMRMQDVTATGVVLPGSRVNYRLLLVGSESAINKFRLWVTPKLSPSEKLLDVNNQRLTLHKTMEQADKYIQLVLLFCLLMCGIAIILSTRQHLHRHYHDVALYRCLGVQEKQMVHIFLWQFVIISVLAGLLGTVFGYLLQTAIASLFSRFIHFALPHIGYTPILLGFFTSAILLFCYAYPIINILPKTSPLFLWRGDVSPTSKKQTRYAIITLVLLIAYVYWAMNFSLLALFIIDTLLISVGLLFVLNIFGLSAVRYISKYTKGSFRRGLSQLIQYPETASIQLTAFTLIVMSLLVLSSVKNDLLGNWQQSLPENTPNYFAFNIANYDIPGLKKLFAKENIQIENIYPMIRGRLTQINNQSVMTAIPEYARNHNSLHRELNLSSMLQLPSDNKIVRGSMWSKDDSGKLVISVEKKMARELGFELGDELSFQVGDKLVTAKIVNFRSVSWSSFHPNFYVIFPQHALDAFPATYITSFHLTAGQKPILNEIIQQFPNVTILDIAGILDQVQTILSYIAAALEYLFIFAFCSAVLILITSVIASMDERRTTYHLLRVLGASRRYIATSVVVEFSALIALTIIFATLLAKCISFILMNMIF